ncbi:MAG: serine hydrolase domain-containing protein, partial [Pseudomonadota bacterium]|nr:serine hydrolase domain-containing protein [Pseudomonadota bacterium]
MLKKWFVGILIAILIVFVVAAVYLFSIIESRPNEPQEARSIVHQPEFSDHATQAVDWLNTLYQENNIPSLSAAVGVNGKLVWSGVIGHADLNKKLIADSDTQYRIGSISKSITAAAVMRMSEKGLIDINAPFKHYVKDFSAGKTEYTIKQLLTHQAGIRHYNPGFSELFNSKEYTSTREAAAIVENDPLMFSPGAGFNYTTYGYTVLSLAMEFAYSLPFEQIVVREVLSPAGMDATHQEKANAAEAQHLAAPYLLMGDRLIDAPDDNLSNKYAGGGYVSTPIDLVKFGNTLLGNDFLSAPAKDVLWTAVPLINGEMNPEGYAL